MTEFKKLRGKFENFNDEASLAHDDEVIIRGKRMFFGSLAGWNKELRAPDTVFVQREDEEDEYPLIEIVPSERYGQKRLVIHEQADKVRNFTLQKAASLRAALHDKQKDPNKMLGGSKNKNKQGKKKRGKGFKPDMTKVKADKEWSKKEIHAMIDSPDLTADAILNGRGTEFDYVDFPQTIVTEIDVGLVFPNLQLAAASWSSLAYANRSVALQTVSTSAGIVGVPYIAWVTAAYDLYLSCLGQRSNLIESPLNYARLFTALAPKIVGSKGYEYRDLPSFMSHISSFTVNVNSNLSFAWPQALEDAFGRTRLVTVAPAISEQDILQVGYPTLVKLWQQTLPPKTKMMNMISEEAFLQYSSAAFSVVVSQGYADFPLACQIYNEVKVDGRHLDIAALGLASSAADNKREAVWIKSSLSGLAAFMFKSAFPYLTNQKLKVSPKEINFTTILTQVCAGLALGDLRFNEVHNYVNIVQDPQSLLPTLSAGQALNATLAVVCSKYPISSAIMSLTGSVNGSPFILGAGARYYTNGSVFSVNFFSFVNETLANLKTGTASQRVDVEKTAKTEIIMPYLSMRKSDTFMNPTQFTDPMSVNSILQGTYPNAVVAPGYNFLTSVAGMPPDLFSASVPDIMFVHGTGPAAALQAYNSAVVTMQANVGSDSIGNSDRPTTEMYWTMELLYPSVNTQNFDMTSVSPTVRMLNRFSWSPNLIYQLYKVVPVTYVTDLTSTAYATWMDELTSIPDIGDVYSTLLLADTTKYVHFRIGAGTEQETVRVMIQMQGWGGGFFDWISDGLGLIHPALGRVSKMFKGNSHMNTKVPADCLIEPTPAVERLVNQLLKHSNHNPSSPLFSPFTSRMRSL